MNSIRTPAYVARFIFLSALYVITGKIGLMISPVNVFATLLWPPTGISLAGLLLWGYRLWPAIAVGAFITNFMTGAPTFVAFGIGAGNTLEALAGALLLERVLGFKKSMGRVQDVLALVLIGTLVSSPISVLFGTLSLWMGNKLPSSALAATISAWWVGDTLSVLIILPFLLIWANRPSNSRLPRLNRIIEASALVLLLSVVSVIAFGGHPPLGIPPFPLLYLIFPFLIWAALRFGQKGAATVSLTVSAFALWGTLRGVGPFSGYSLLLGLYLMQVYQAIVAVTALILGAVVTERLQSTKELSEANTNCEKLLQVRTAELAKTFEEARKIEERFRLLVQGVRDYAIFMLDPSGHITSWNLGAERIKGYVKNEVIGKHFSIFYPEAEVAAGKPDFDLRFARSEGSFETEGWRIRKDGSRFWASLLITSIHDASGNHIGFSKVTRDLTERKNAEDQVREAYLELEQRVQVRTVELRKANEFLQQSESRLILASEFGKIGFWDWNIVTNDLFWNPQHEIQMGYEPGHSHRNLDDFTRRIHPDDKVWFTEMRRNAIESKSTLQTEFRVLLPGNIVRWISTRAQAEYDDSGRPIRMLGANIDVTERKRAELALKQSEAHKSAVFGAAIDCIISMDHLGKIIDFNPAAEKTFGYDCAKVLGKEMAELIIPPRFREPHRRGLSRYLATGEGPVIGRLVEMSAIRSNGTEFPIELSILALQTDSEPVFTAFIRDITQRKSTERNREFLEKVTIEAGVNLDYESTLRRVTQLMVPDLCDWCIIHIRKNEEIQVTSVSHVDQEKERLARETLLRFPTQLTDEHGVGHVIRTGKSEIYPDVNDTTWAAKTMGVEYPEVLRELGTISFMCVPLQAHGLVFGALSFVFGASGRRFHTNDLSLAEELAIRGGLAIDNARSYRIANEAIVLREEFMSIASHEMKTPLTPLKMQLDILKQVAMKAGAALGPYSAALLRIIEKSDQQVARLVRLCDDLLDVTRITEGRLNLNIENVDLSDLIHEVIDRFQSEIDRTECIVELELDRTVKGHWDRLRMEQAVINLLTNAIKYGAGKPVKISVIANQNIAQLIVRDYGIGIKKEDQSRIFERFERAASMKHFSGLGLGLFITRQIIQAHGGSIHLESELGKGTTFFVEIPLKVSQERTKGT